jgi:hypothetical protein
VGGDVAELMEVLAPEVTLWADSGGKLRAPRRPVRGAEKVARLLSAGAGGLPDDTLIRFVDLNGGPAAVATSAGTPYAVFLLDLDIDTDRVTAIRIVQPGQAQGTPSDRRSRR